MTKENKWITGEMGGEQVEVKRYKLSERKKKRKGRKSGAGVGGGRARRNMTDWNHEKKRMERKNVDTGIILKDDFSTHIR